MARARMSAAETPANNTEAEAVPTPKKRTRNAKEEGTTQEAPAVNVTPDEETLRDKYGKTHQIIPGSLRFAGGREGWGHKRTVEVRCSMPTCESVRVVATSDLQWGTTCYCLSCATDVKKGRRNTKKTKKSL